MEPFLELCKELTECDGVPGQEVAVRRIMERHLKPVATLECDRLGSLIARKEGGASGPRIMVAAHLDEVGFMVTDIEDDGFLRFQELGGWWEQVMLAQRVTVHTHKGPLPGVIGSKPPHVLPPDVRKRPVEKKDMFIDIGALSGEEAREVGVRPGDAVVPVCPFTLLANPKLLMAKAWDNRVGCIAVVELLRSLTSHPNAVYGVATVQEEVGLRGAETSTEVVAPDVGFAVDVCIAGDTPGIKRHEARARLGGGPTFLLYDRSMVPHTGLRELVVETAAAEGIPLQFDVMPGGGTDAGRMHLFGRGVPSAVIGIPARYIHTHAAVIHRDDIEAVVALLRALVARLDQATVEALRA